MNTHRNDFNDIVKRLGSNMQNALTEIQKNHVADLDFSKREQEQMIVDFQETLTNKNEELLKEQIEIINRIKDNRSINDTHDLRAPARRLRVGLCWILCYLGPGGALAEIHPGDDHKQ